MNTQQTQPSEEGVGHSFGISVWTVVGDTDPVPIDAHVNRAAAVHEALTFSEYLEAHWGSLDDRDPSPLVEVIVDIDEKFANTPSGAPTSLRDALHREGTKLELAAAITIIVDRLRKEQEQHRIGRFDIYLADGNRVRCEPDRAPAVIGFRIPDSHGPGRTA